MPKKPYSKYKSKITVVDGIKFRSKKESERYKQLMVNQQLGEIKELELQVPFDLPVYTEDRNLIHTFKYVADFTYCQKDLVDNPENGQQYLQGWKQIVEDCKGFRTPDYKLKKKLMKAIYGIDIRET